MLNAAQQPRTEDAVVADGVPAPSRTHAYVSTRYWHAEDAAHVIDALDSSAQGLTQAEATRRLARDGANELREVAVASIFEIALRQLRSVVVWLLLAAVAATAVLGEFADAVTIGLVLVLNVAIGTWIEVRARRAIHALMALDAPTAVVLRDGASVTRPARELVVGDVILLTAGQRVPADARLIDADELRTNEAALTGESEPVSKSAHRTLDAYVALADRTTLVFRGTSIAAGHARAIVVATGDATEIGRIGTLVSAVDVQETPLDRQLDRLGRMLAIAAIGGGAVVLGVEWLRNGFELALLQTGIAVAVAAIPEGLIAVSTIAMALGVRRMAQRSAIVRHLHAVETLGAVTVVCSDKTGTLTLGALTATTLWIPDRELPLPLPAPSGELEWGAHERAQRTLRTLVLASRSAAPDDPASDPVDVAFLLAAERCGLDVAATRGGWQELTHVPFTSTRGYMAIVQRGPDGVARVHAKGAPPVLLARCTQLLTDEGVVALTPASRSEILARSEAMGRRGLRVLAVASGAPIAGAETPDALTFLGLIGLTDPVVPGARETLARLRGAGVRTIMLTGDQGATAHAVAESLGLADAHAAVWEGRAIDAMSDDALMAALPQLSIVARVTPTAKLRIVKALQQHGEVVVMLGDGVNDAPALKQADVGVTMGGRGTDLARESASVVLQNDRFETIAVAVEDGRRIGVTIRRVVHYLVGCNMAELLAVIGAVLLGYPTPLTAVQLLWLNVLTDTAPALALAGGGDAIDVMRHPPRSRDEHVFSRRAALRTAGFAVLMATATLIAFLWFFDGAPSSLAEARTVAFVVLGLTQIAHLVDLSGAWGLSAWRRSRIAAAAVATLVVQIAFFLMPPLARLLELAPPASFDEWMGVIGLALAPSLIALVLRTLVVRRARHPDAPGDP